MKAFVILSLLAVSASAAPNTFNYDAGTPDQRCPRVDNSLVPIHIQHPNDCSKFYKCFDGRAYQMDCPYGQHWAAYLNRCDYPELARCRTYSLPVEAAFAYSEGVRDVRCPRTDDPYRPIHMQHPTDCSKFFKCFDGNAYVITCPQGQEWAAAMNRCDYPAVAQCRNRYSEVSDDKSLQVQVVEKVQPVEAAFIYNDGVRDVRCPRNDDPFRPFHMQHPTDCSKFFKCFDGNAYTISCPAGQEWAAHLNRCEKPSIAKCRATYAADDDEDEEDVEAVNGSEEAENETVNEEQSNEEQSNEEETPEARKSVAAKKSKGEKVYSVEELETIFGVYDLRCPYADHPYNPVHLPHPRDCRLFYKCYNHKAYLHLCPANEHWSVELNRCDYPELARCTV